MAARPLATASLLLLLPALSACSSGTKCEGPDLKVTGELRPTAIPITFDTVAASIQHRRDVDAWEDGLITSVQLDLSRGGACPLRLIADGCPDALGRLQVKTAILTVDSQCPGFSSPQEGTYMNAAGTTLGLLTLTPPDVPAQNAESACYDGTIVAALQGTLLLAGQNAKLNVSDSKLTVEGTFVSQGTASSTLNCEPVFPNDAQTTDSGQDAAPETDAATDELSPPTYVSVTFTIDCPKCTTKDPVVLQASKGWVIGQPEYTHLFKNPIFPFTEELNTVQTPTGSTVYWPEGTVTFRAWQDTKPGGSAPEEGEPVSKLSTSDLAAYLINKVEMTLDPETRPVVSCTPGEDLCVSLKVTAHCSDDGKSLAETACPEQQACSESTGKCEPVVCAPGSVVCATAKARHACLPSGTGFGEETQCGEGYSCVGGSCMSDACFGEVVLLVDTSGSMSLNWDAVSASLQAITGMSPLSAFGLANFPQVNSVCGVAAALQVPLAQGQAGKIAGWFADNYPFGQTPLVLAMQTMLDLLPGVFVKEGGALVLLSDGADTCAYPTLPVEEREPLIIADLEAATAALYSQNKIRTYVVGYNFQGNTAELDAIAASGGTGYTTHTKAGNESELTGALVGIVKDLKLCIEE